jgi:RNA polymerase nonessential primary-like sigma factor
MINIYYREIRKYHPLTKEQEQQLTRLVKHGDEQARKTLIEHNLRLVTHIAQEYYHPSVELLDLIQEGNIGLIEAVDRFDPELGYQFSTFAVWWIRKMILLYLGKDEDKVSLDLPILGEAGEILRLGDTIIDEENTLGGQSCEKQGARLEHEQSMQQMRERMAKLPMREKEVLIMLYGIGLKRALTLQEIARLLNITPERVGQIRDKALGRLK